MFMTGIKVLSADTALVDHVIPPELLKEIHQLFVAHSIIKAQPDAWKNNSDKYKMSLDLYMRVSGIVNDAISKGLYSEDLISLGGSGLNAMSLAYRALKGTGHEFEMTCLSVAGHRANGVRLRRLLEELGIGLAPNFENDPECRYAQGTTASGYVFLIKDEETEKVKKQVAGYAGNGKDLITADDVRELFDREKYQLVYLSGNAREKFGDSAAQAILQECVTHGSDIVLTMPTQSRSGMDAKTRDFFKKAAESAVIISCNKDELLNTFTTDSKDEAIAGLQARMRNNAGRNPVAIITDGMKPLTIVTCTEIRTIPAPAKLETVVKDSLGAGDNFLGGVVTAILKGRTIEEAIAFGGICSDQVIQQYGAHLKTDPKNLADEYFGAAPEVSTILAPISSKRHPLEIRFREAA